MQSDTVRFTDYGESIANVNLTFNIGVVGISQKPPSLNELVYMCYLYNDVRYVFGRILVTRIGNLSKWPEENEFVAYCQSHQDVEFCSPINIEISEFGCCDIACHLDSGQSIEDIDVIKRLDRYFMSQRLENNVRPKFEIPKTKEELPAIAEPSSSALKLKFPRLDNMWKHVVNWLYDVEREPVDPDIRNF